MSDLAMVHWNQPRYQWRDLCSICRAEILDPWRAVVINARGEMMHNRCIPPDHPAFRYRLFELMHHQVVIEMPVQEAAAADLPAIQGSQP